MSRRIALRAPAKLNLGLAVTGRRDDGYHELRSVFVTLDLHDDVLVATHDRLEVRTSVPIAGEDLAARAVRALAEASGHAPSAFVRVRKRIPLAAGLGGGSSDAGAVLRATAALWGVEADLVRIAARVGSDVPFFASGVGAALVGGRGEDVTPLPAPSHPLHVVVVRPTIRLATRDVFAELRRDEWGTTARVDALARAFVARRVDPEIVRLNAVNDLLAAAERRCEAIASWRAAASSRGIELRLTGSGPALFAVADDRADALRMARILGRAGLRARPQIAGSETARPGERGLSLYG